MAYFAPVHVVPKLLEREGCRIPPHDVERLITAYEFLLARGGDQDPEQLLRDSNSFRPRLQRLLTLVAKARPDSATPFLVALWGAVPRAEPPLELVTLVAALFDARCTAHPPLVIARGALLIDRLRHLHMSIASSAEKRSVVQEATALRASVPPPLRALLDSSLRMQEKVLDA